MFSMLHNRQAWLNTQLLLGLLRTSGFLHLRSAKTQRAIALMTELWNCEFRHIQTYKKPLLQINIRLNKWVIYSGCSKLAVNLVRDRWCCCDVCFMLSVFCSFLNSGSPFKVLLILNKLHIFQNLHNFWVNLVQSSSYPNIDHWFNVISGPFIYHSWSQ